jgi:hypothetical protein
MCCYDQPKGKDVDWLRFQFKRRCVFSSSLLVSSSTSTLSSRVSMQLPNVLAISKTQFLKSHLLKPQSHTTTRYDQSQECQKFSLSILLWFQLFEMRHFLISLFLIFFGLLGKSIKTKTFDDGFWVLWSVYTRPWWIWCMGIWGLYNSKTSANMVVARIKMLKNKKLVGVVSHIFCHSRKVASCRRKGLLGSILLNGEEIFCQWVMISWILLNMMWFLKSLIN